MVEINPSEKPQGKGPGKTPANRPPPKDFKLTTDSGSKGYGSSGPGGNPNPAAGGPHSSKGSSAGGGSSSDSGDWFGGYFNKQQEAEFKNNLCKQIVQQIGKQKQKEKKASKRLRLAEEGKDMYAAD